MKQFLQWVLIFLLVCMAQLQAHSAQDNQKECNVAGKSKLYQEWVERWKGKYETDIYYHQTGTPSIINDMLEQCDIKGLTLMLNDIGKREFILHQASGGVIFLITAIESSRPQAVQFLLEHKLMQKDNKELYDEYQIEELEEWLAPLELATQKLQEAKVKGDSRAMQNYEKIIKLLQEHGVK